MRSRIGAVMIAVIAALLLTGAITVINLTTQVSGICQLRMAAPGLVPPHFLLQVISPPRPIPTSKPSPG